MVLAENAFMFVLKFDDVTFINHRLSGKFEVKTGFCNQFLSGELRVRLFPVSLLHRLTDDGCGNVYPTLKTHDHENSFSFETLEKYEAVCEFLCIEPCKTVVATLLKDVDGRTYAN